MARRWSPQEKEQLRRAIVERRQDIHEVRIRGRKPERILRQARRMRLIGALRSPSWPKAQTKKLRQLRRLKFSPQQILESGLLGQPFRSYDAITHRCTKLKLANRRRSRAMRRKKFWRRGERQRFHEFLLNHSTELTPKQIGRIFRVSRSTVASHQKQLGIKVPAEVVQTRPETRRKRRRSIRRRSRSRLAQYDSYINWREKEMLQVAGLMRQNFSGKEHYQERVCATCHRSFPLHPIFYYFHDIRVAIGRHRRYDIRCTLCVSRQRHTRLLNRQKR